MIDPRRSRTAEEADEHHAIIPGTDAHFLFGDRAHALRRGPRRPGPVARALRGHRRGRAARGRLHARARRARTAGSRPTRSAASRASSPPPTARACYGRIGTCTQEFGTLASWLVDVVNVLTGNLDREGGAMFTRAAGGQRNTAGTPGRRQGRDARPLEEPRARPARGVRRAAGRVPGRGDRDARATARSARSITVAGNPVGLDAATPSGSTARSRSSTSWSRSTSTSTRRRATPT